MTRYAAAFISFLAVVSAQRRGASTTASDVENGVCKENTLIFARGTTEQGNMGSVVGPVLATAMKQALGDDKVAVQGVNYAANVNGAISGATNPANAAGAKDMAAQAAAAVAACPNTKVVLSGYSQGAEQVRGALMNMPNNNVVAAVTFGDPLMDQDFANIDAAKTKVNCVQGDGVCNGQFAISAAHLSYGSNGNVDDSVQFIMQMVGGAAPAAN
ncbi:cutinase [Tothia fuscella]|uniref:Cutinase n=1 Tax=Tothia fuscella TaxID=1048955 RepID=A0A9P4U408_9PEZI|nr:cutinase [Tothia fuscella]